MIIRNIEESSDISSTYVEDTDGLFNEYPDNEEGGTNDHFGEAYEGF